MKAAVLLAAVAAMASACSSSATADSGLVITSKSQGWTFRDGQKIKVSIGPNKIFKPGIRINILECADPGGTLNHLPTRPSSCDENTVQGNSIIPGSSGGFSESAYTVYKLPSAPLGEGPSWVPVCNEQNPCVLYVGLDQEDFTKPKIFSHPFTVTGGGS